jgi:hypothetical protein
MSAHAGSVRREHVRWQLSMVGCNGSSVGPLSSPVAVGVLAGKHTLLQPGVECSVGGTSLFMTVLDHPLRFLLQLNPTPLLTLG